MKLPIQSSGSRYTATKYAGVVKPRQQGIVPQRIKLQTWECSCDPDNPDICACESNGRIRVFHAVLGRL